MSEHYTVLGLFRKVDKITAAVDPVKDEFELRDGDVEVLTSAAYPDGVLIEDATLEHQVERVMWLFPFLIGIGGFITGVVLAGGTAYIMNLNVSGKDPFSYAPTGIMTYEFSLLFAVIGSVISLLYFTGLPNWHDRAYDPEISDGALGLLIKVTNESDQHKAVEMMKELGAYKTRLGKNDF